ncbi:collagenase-like [Uranotaenia lowii]|uniref:collagenase-like n=1 Tax=Uranotaenia lowii TaxID=190385 RepID=UPI002479A760|nr:collagenase-like [Uranotaenia lowii]
MSPNKFVNTLVVLLVSVIGFTRPEDDSRIVNGQNAEFGQFPYQALLLLEMPDGRSLCGGSLISDRWVLAAGHCTDDASAVEVRLGLIDRSYTDDGSLVLVSNDFFEHPDFDRETLKNDIALIHLPEIVKFTDRISPVELPRGHETYQGRVAIASGFGRTTTDGKPSSRLNYAVMDVISNTVCTASYPGSIRSTNICSVGRNRSSTCKGDSGGPLRLEDENILIGVASFVNRMAGCDMNYPVGFARVSEYVDYIREATADKGISITLG